MGRNWTDEQKKVIEERKKDILVSAAAGSGKTAVLVERIIEKVCDKDEPVDVDRILVVTFTNAAAKEMKERLRSELKKRSDENPLDTYLYRQTTLVAKAHIKTIDSFCLDVIRNHFSLIDLDPSFRTGDEREMLLLRQDVCEKLFLRHYENEDQGFLMLSDIMSKKNSDDPLMESMLKLYDYAMSYPWPKDFLSECIKIYDVTTKEEFYSSELFKFYFSYLKAVLFDAVEGYNEAIEKTRGINGSDKISRFLTTERDSFNSLKEINDPERFITCLFEVPFERYPTDRNPDFDPEIKEFAKNRRDEIKERITKKVKDEAEILITGNIIDRIKMVRPYAKAFVSLTEEFYEAFSEEKRRKDLIDFSDQEHLALSILIDEKTKEPTAAAKEYAAYFDEIMIDEYQDSNYVQEIILKSVSKERDGGHNYFCVGDVKQSIYRFRLARPEIFMEKYERYEKPDCTDEIRIDLNKNFRSRKEVLDITNEIFKEIMKKDLGNVSYGEKEALYPGNKDYVYPEGKEDSYLPEILLCKNDKDIYDDLSVTDKTGVEARMIADRIYELKKDLLVTDKETNKLRPLKYSDIVILLRSAKDKADTIYEVLSKRGIPAYLESREGYFSSYEISVMLSFLSLTDNSLQDIPLASVLLSPMFSFTEEELTDIKRNSEKEKFYEAFYEYINGEKEENETGRKAQRFKNVYGKIRKESFDTALHELISMIFDETGFLNYVSAMPGGEKKRENLLKLYDLAADFEKTSYKGLFRFMRYIDKLKKVESDYGDAGILSENDDVVRIMSIHKSKGLEFPVVFVSNLGGKIDGRNNRDDVALSQNLGIGFDCIDIKKRIRYDSFIKKAINTFNDTEEKGEELRILYVALTRAREKLIMTGVLPDPEEALKNRKRMTFSNRLFAKSYLDWIMPVALANEDICTIKIRTPEETAADEVVNALSREEKKRGLKRITEAGREEKEEPFFNYPYKKEDKYKVKYSVSEIKHRAMEEVIRDDENPAEDIIKKEKEFERTVPKFLSAEEEENIGAKRGTAMHRFMECFDFNREDYKGCFDEEKNRMLSEGKLKSDQSVLISKSSIEKFLSTDMARRMHEASKKNLLFIEKAFVFSESADKLFSDGDETELLVQGIIDAFFIEDDGIVLLDYKTDRVKSGDELLSLYKKQLYIYADAIEKAYDMRVKESCLYSFCLDETVFFNHNV